MIARLYGLQDASYVGSSSASCLQALRASLLLKTKHADVVDCLKEVLCHGSSGTTSVLFAGKSALLDELLRLAVLMHYTATAHLIQ